MNDAARELIKVFKILKDGKTKFAVCPTSGQKTMRLVITRDREDPDLVIGKDMLCDNCGLCAPTRIAPERVPLEK